MTAPRLSLCIIAGNEEANILRVLDSFAPAFDELCLVIATGSTPADATRDLARQWCIEHGKAFVPACYRNQPQNNWPHVDDFAAARNMAFSLATGDWLFWADCDDLASADIGQLRDIAANSHPSTLHLFPYNVAGTGKRPPRERLISRELFRAGRCWRGAIHENLLAHEGDALEEHAAPIWLHAPRGNPATNRDRNLRILSAQLRDAPTHFFYWHQELYTRGNPADAAKSGALVLQLPNVEPSFRYQAALNLCRLEADTDKAVQLALTAHEIFPWCREAVAELLKCYMELGARSHVKQWFNVFQSLTPPTGLQRPWTHEPKWYEWAGMDLSERVLRWLGEYTRAAAIAKLRQHRLTVIHITGDARRAVALREAWLDHAHAPESIRYVFAPRDDATRRALAQFSGPSKVRGPVKRITDADLPTPGWDAALGQSAP